MSMGEIFAPIEAKYRSEIFADTWGHLHPVQRVKYKGFVVFTQGEYGQLVPIRSRFDDLPDSPWFYQDLQDFIWDKRGEQGEVYKFEGTYEKFKNGKCRFSGKVKKIKI